MLFELLSFLFCLLAGTGVASGAAAGEGALSPSFLSPHRRPMAFVTPDLAAVGLGAAAGACARHAIATKYPSAAPWHIGAINVLGSFALGVVSQAAPVLNPRLKLCLGTGLCGGFTTFSTFSVDMVNLLNSGRTGTAFGYLMLNNGGGLGAARLGMLVAQGWIGKR